MDLWQVGILLIGIGFLFFSVYLAMVFKETADTIGQARKIIERNSREIEDIIRDTSEILTSVNTVSTAVSNVSTLGVGKAAVKTAMSVAKIRKKRKGKGDK